MIVWNLPSAAALKKVAQALYMPAGAASRYAYALSLPGNDPRRDGFEAAWFLKAMAEIGELLARASAETDRE